MRKKRTDNLEKEALKLGLQRMLKEVQVQLDSGNHTEPIRAVFSERKTHIEQRLQELISKVL